MVIFHLHTVEDSWNLIMKLFFYLVIVNNVQEYVLLYTNKWNIGKYLWNNIHISKRAIFTSEKYLKCYFTSEKYQLLDDFHFFHKFPL